jgi:hypothetical protein
MGHAMDGSLLKENQKKIDGSCVLLWNGVFFVITRVLRWTKSSTVELTAPMLGPIGPSDAGVVLPH